VEIAWSENKQQLVCKVRQGSEVMGCLVIDSIVGGRSCGGLRMVPEIDEAEMCRLARNMTLKFGFVGLPRGGAKAAVRGNPEAPQQERWQRLGEFGQAIAPLLFHRVFSPGADMGIEPAGIRYMLKTGGVRVRPRQSHSPPPGYYAALTVLAGAKQATRRLGLALSECSVAVEGWGKVGSALGGLLAEANARVVAISTSRGAIFNPQGLDVGHLLRLRREQGSRVVDLYADAERLDPSALLELPVDLLCPCACHDTLHAGNASRVKASMICAGANNPVTPEAERILFERGVLCLPDFVTNCGVVLGSAMEVASVSKERISSFIERRVGARIAWLLDEAAREHVLPREVAVPFARRRFEQMRRNAANPTLLSRLLHVGVELNRRGLIPRPLVTAMSLPYFERLLA